MPRTPPLPAIDNLNEDLEIIGSLEQVRSLLNVVCRVTGMRFSAVARVTDSRWVALAVHDEIDFGLKAGADLALDTTLCKEVRASGQPILIQDSGTDPVYRDHHTPRIYNIASYVSVPIVLEDGAYFGNLCAIDPAPAAVAQAHVVEMFTLFARLIATQLEAKRKQRRAEVRVDAELTNSRQREEFIAIMAHDLRNPLASIDAGVQALRRVADDHDQVRRLTARLGRSVGRMKLLIDDVLDLARGRLGGGLGIALASVPDLDAALLQVVDELRLGNPDRPIDCRIEALPTVQCDRPRVQQLMSNLLSNAIVHGRPGAEIAVFAAAQGDQLVIRVANHGDPIEPDVMDSLFGAFEQGKRKRRDGLGLGLYICDQVALAHGGRIEVTSSADAGTEFTAYLPLAR